MRIATILAAGVALFATAPRASAITPADLQGHVALGYAKLFVPDAPGGSLSVAAGLDLPVAGPLRAGVDVGYHLLGTRTVERGSFFASVDYSVFEADLLVHWLPTGAGPVARVSFGPALISAHADLSTASGGGAAFSDLAVSESAPGVVGEVSLLPHRDMPVKLGLELGARTAFLAHDTWTVADVRVIAHY
jgi:hypothetical protein